MNKSEWIDFANTFNKRDAELLRRSYTTLMGNVYKNTGYAWSPYRCVSPGKNSFLGIWNWDSAFHSVGLCRWDTELAKESIYGFF